MDRRRDSIEDGTRNFELSDFDILKTVGTGTFGRVCLVQDESSQQYFALKVLAVADVIRLKQHEHVKNEKNILESIKHPFIIRMYWTHHDDSFLYMLFEFASGGELFSHLRSQGKFETETAKFYAAEITLALEFLHEHHSIIYRDLKPENLLLDRHGHVKLSDFGFAKRLKDRTWTLCGTAEYLAPEIIQSKGHNKAVDWWALGILIYEMLTGAPPFCDESPCGIYEKVLEGKITFAKGTDPVAKDLIRKLLTADRTRRLGNMKNGAHDVKNHRWYRNLKWDDVYNKRIQPPLVPKGSREGDTSNFDEYPEDDWIVRPQVSQKELAIFDGF